MQLTRKPDFILPALASASCALLYGTAAAADEDRPGEPWNVQAGALLFTERDLVSGTELILQGTTALSPQSRLTLGSIIDVLVGPTPNGATPTNRPQTFSTPSGFNTFTTPAGEIPLDPTFQDSRLEVYGGYDRDYARTVRGNFAARFSQEFDYQSVGASTRWEFDNSARTTTWMAGVSFTHDRVHPVGGIPEPLAVLPPPGEPLPRVDAARSLNTNDLLLGVTQVFGRRTLAQLNYAYGVSDGYNTDPYKIVSVVDSVSGETLAYVYEKRPSMRRVHSLYTRVKHRYDSGILDLNYRYFTDDWDIDAHNVGFGYQFPNAQGSFWEPTFRWYHQSAAGFYRHSITDAEPLAENLSADRRLAKLDAVTLGIRWGKYKSTVEGFSVSLQYYYQFGEQRPDDAVGVQREFDLFPETHALLLQLNNSFNW